jgi:hypothetical protein
MFFDRQKFIDEQRGMDRHGRLSNSDIERMADFEQLEFDIHDIEDIGDVKRILFKLVDLARTTDARR